MTCASLALGEEFVERMREKEEGKRNRRQHEYQHLGTNLELPLVDSGIFTCLSGDAPVSENCIAELEPPRISSSGYRSGEGEMNLACSFARR